MHICVYMCVYNIYVCLFTKVTKNESSKSRIFPNLAKYGCVGSKHANEGNQRRSNRIMNW